MTSPRPIRLTLTARPTREGAGVQLRRVFGFSSEELFDPFLLLDDFRSDTPAHYRGGFPWHPHRGIETITYVLRGDVEHGDSLGNSGTISSGDVQWMTAGSGIIHQEMPRGDEHGSMHGFQLWANLPAEDKMMAPRYRDIEASRIPVLTTAGGVAVKIIAGALEAARGPVDDIVTEPEYYDITVPPAATYGQATVAGHTAFIYVIAGSGTTGTTPVENRMLVLYGDGDEVRVSSGAAGLRFLLCCGKPLREPIAWRGPIVMNSEAELDTAFREYRDGTFIKHR